MDKKNRKDLDKRLQKFAIKGQEKLVGQLRQILNSKQDNAPAKEPDSEESPPNRFNGRAQLFVLMDSFREKIEINNQSKEKTENIFFEILCKPLIYPNKNNLTNLEKTQQMVANNFGGNSDFSVFIPESGIFYARNRTNESKQNLPNIFDPKVQSLTIAETFIQLGKLYQNLGLNYRDRFDIVLRYNDATNLAVGSVSPETFLPSANYKEKYLTIYVVRELHELLGQTADTTAVIIIELLKRLRYQGIVNKDFFIHAISKHLAQK